MTETPKHTDEQLSQLRFYTSRTTGGGLNLELLTSKGIYQCHVTSFPAYQSLPADLIEQYVDWINRRLDTEQRISEILETFREREGDVPTWENYLKRALSLGGEGFNEIGRKDR